MILLWFILATALIFAIARYNESNKLFWTLLFALVVGFAGTKMVYDINRGSKQSDVKLTQVYSTQVQHQTSNALQYFTTDAFGEAPNVVTAQNPVSQTMPVSSEPSVILSKVFGRTRDQPILSLLKPPELCLQKDFLILHDSG